MSIMGTGIAAAVAQTHEAAREQRKAQDARRREETERSRAIREAYEVHLESLEEGEGTSARLQADGQLDNEHDPGRAQEAATPPPDPEHEDDRPVEAIDGEAPPPQRLDIEA